MSKLLDFFKSPVKTTLKGLTSISGYNLGYSFSSFDDKNTVKNSYLKNDDVYSIVSKGAKTMANSIKWKVFEVGLDGEKTEVFDNELIQRLYEPNKYQTLTEFREQAYTFLMVTGRSFIGGLESVGFKEYSSLHNLPSQITSIALGDLSNPITKYEVDWNMQRIWQPENVLYTKYITIDECDYFNGLSPFRAGGRLLESSNNLVTADASTLKNRGASGLLTNRSQDVQLESERQQLEDALKGQIGGAEKFNKVIPTTANVDFVSLALSPKDLEILKSDISKRRRFSNLYGFDSSQFNDPANKTYNNQKEASKSAFINVYIPTDKKFVDGLNKWLAPQFLTKNGKKLIIEQDLSSIEALQSDKKMEAEKDKITMEGISTILAMPLSSTAKSNLLQNEYGFDEERAIKLLETEGTKNTQLETLKSLSPLLANKLIEKLTDEEVRILLGL
jgi:HK97 family phage portal protein